MRGLRRWKPNTPVTATRPSDRLVARVSSQTRTITEESRGILYVHTEWAQEFPWLVQGITARTAGNFASFGKQTAETLHKQWLRLREETGMRTSVLGRQVHAARVLVHEKLSPGLMLADDSDGQITSKA